MDNIIYMFDIPLFTYDGYADVMEDGTQYQALEWKLIDMENYMNAPIQLEWTDKDILEDFEKYHDKKAVSRRFCIPVSQVTEILKRNGVKEK